jgi:hypothetical protein
VHRSIKILVIAGLGVALLAACGGTDGRSLPTIDETAVIAERLPTAQAQQKTYVAQLTQNAPTMNAIMTSMATGGAPTGQAPFTGTPGTALPAGSAQATQPPDSGNSGGVYGAIDFDDVDVTTIDQPIAVGQTVTGTITDPLQAHNWRLQGTAGQTITLTVDFTGTLDPRARVFTSSGTILSASSSFGGSTSYVLSAAGLYIIRVDSWPVDGIANGTYTLTLE